MNDHNNRTDHPPYGILSVLMIGAFISFLNSTLLNIALPSIMKDLKIDAATVQWLTTGFMLVNGILIPTTAFLIQKYSVKRLFLTALSLFSIGTILAGMAHIFPILLLGRMLQASGSAILMPLLMNVMLVTFPVERRGAAMGVFGLILMFAPAIGPTLSGWIVEHYDWRMLFHFVTPIAIIVLLLGFFMLKDKKDQVDMHLDFLSLLLSSAAFGGLLFGLSSAGNDGWSSPKVYGTLIVGCIALYLFVLRQSKQTNPMLNFKVFEYPMFTLSAIISMVVTMTMFGAMLLFPIYVQTIRGISPLNAGLLLLPGAIVNAVMSPVAGKLFDRFGGRILSVIGLIIMTGTTYYFSQLSLSTSYTYLMIVFSIRAFGMSMVNMPVQTNGLNQLPPCFYPHGTAMNNTLTQISGAIGTALLVTVMSARAKTHAADLAANAMKHLTGHPTGAALAELKHQVALKAMLEGINDAFFVATLISAVALFLAFFIKRAKQADNPIEETKSGNAIETKLARN